MAVPCRRKRSSQRQTWLVPWVPEDESFCPGSRVPHGAPHPVLGERGAYRRGCVSPFSPLSLFISVCSRTCATVASCYRPLPYQHPLPLAFALPPIWVSPAACGGVAGGRHEQAVRGKATEEGVDEPGILQNPGLFDLCHGSHSNGLQPGDDRPRKRAHAGGLHHRLHLQVLSRGQRGGERVLPVHPAVYRVVPGKVPPHACVRSADHGAGGSGGGCRDGGQLRGQVRERVSWLDACVRLLPRILQQDGGVFGAQLPCLHLLLHVLLSAAGAQDRHHPGSHPQLITQEVSMHAGRPHRSLPRRLPGHQRKP